LAARKVATGTDPKRLVEAALARNGCDGPGSDETGSDETGSDETGSGGSERPDDLVALKRDLLEAAQRSRDEAGRARRLAGTQTQTELIAELRNYAEQLEREAFLFEQQAAEFAGELATTRRLTHEIQQQADQARERMRQMIDRLRKPEQG
jgi:hypothetical protein